MRYPSKSLADPYFRCEKPIMARACVGLGSNLADRRQNLDDAVRRLGRLDAVRVLRVSSYHQTAPVGGPPQGDFLNAAVQLETTLPPLALLCRCLEVEAEMGRQRDVRWGPRVIDIDMLLYGDEVIESPGLVLPHPRMHERLFVLDPLVELAPDLVHPRLGKTVRQLRQELAANAPAGGKS